ncbi:MULTISPECIES: Hsp20 family protein [Corallincola]|uniref:Heat-shock protein n=2 Tax=Corallincola TaxID=1775176 RepID=A0A368NG75_9GAMM|nr:MULTISPECIES: Hsp20 family protein [Corallincola]RCU49572.1 heat-shock protein [Corallincola holothuriorum]TAA47869.1 Hsp20 family protein [Corallincola spongiicola]
MNTIDLSPLYRNSIGFDQFASLLDRALKSDNNSAGYPPYNIEVLDENQYGIQLAVAGFTLAELDITVEKNVLTIRGNKGKEEGKKYLYQGIARRGFERKFNLADHVEVRGADLENGLLMVHLVKEIPEAMKPRSIAINYKDAATSQPRLNEAEEQQTVTIDAA